MEFWEGALLVVGGIWLVGKVSRNSPSHPLNSAQLVANPPQTAGNTVGTQQDGSPALVWGEPLAPPLPLLPSHPSIMTVSPINQHIAVAPIASHVQINPVPVRFSPIVTVPKPQTTPNVSTYANRVPVRGKFYDL